MNSAFFARECSVNWTDFCGDISEFRLLLPQCDDSNVGVVTGESLSRETG